MMAFEYEDFLAECSRQSVILTDEQLYAPYSYSKPHTYVPTEFTQAIAIAVDRLTQNPLDKLAQKPLVSSDEILRDPAARALTNIINDSVTKSETHDEPAITTVSEYDVNVCSRAEPNFAKTMLYLENPADSDEELGGQIITDEQEQALFIRKRRGEPSALSLQPVVIAGIRYPAGGLFRIDLKDDKLDNLDYPYMPTAETTVEPFSSLTAARFLRLSAFCFSPQTRQAFRYNTFNSNPLGIQAIDYAQTTPLEALKDAVQVVASQRRLHSSSTL